jgi:HEAT repeat protein
VTGAEVSLRKSAAEALTWCRKTETDVVPALLTASLSDTNEEVRQLAQAGLDHMSLSQEKAVRLCATQLGESTYAEVALRKSGALGVPALIEALESADAAVRIKAARTLSTLGEVAAAAAPALGQTLQDDDPEVRLAAAKSLWNVAKAADLVVPVLVELLEARGTVDADVSENERRFLQTVMEALGRIEPPATAAVPALTLRTKDKNRQMRESALSVLQKVAPTVAKKVVLRP